MRNHLSKFAEEISDSSVTGMMPISPKLDDFTKFDRINLFDFRRMMP